jgi:hypothetical protein
MDQPGFSAIVVLSNVGDPEMGESVGRFFFFFFFFAVFVSSKKFSFQLLRAAANLFASDACEM